MGHRIGARLNPLQSFQVCFAGSVGLRQRFHIFAQVIERRHNSLGLQFPANAETMLESQAGNKSGSERAEKTRSLHPTPQPTLPRKIEQTAAHDRNECAQLLSF
jgi:hypothetical protein